MSKCMDSSVLVGRSRYWDPSGGPDKTGVWIEGRDGTSGEDYTELVYDSDKDTVGGAYLDSDRSVKCAGHRHHIATILAYVPTRRHKLLELILK